MENKTKHISSYDKFINENYSIDEEAESKAQRRLMGQAYAIKRGTLKPEELDVKYKDQIMKLADEMSLEDLQDFAETKETDLPDKVDEDAMPAGGQATLGSVPGMGVPTPASADAIGSGDTFVSDLLGSSKRKKKKKKKKKLKNVSEWETFEPIDIFGEGYPQAWEEFKKKNSDWNKNADTAWDNAVEVALSFYKDPDDAEKAAAQIIGKEMADPNNKLEESSKVDMNPESIMGFLGSKFPGDEYNIEKANPEDYDEENPVDVTFDFKIEKSGYAPAEDTIFIDTASQSWFTNDLSGDNFNSSSQLLSQIKKYIRETKKSIHG